MYFEDDIKRIFNQDIFTNFTGDNAESTAYFLVECIGLAGAAFIIIVLLLWILHLFQLARINKKLAQFKTRKAFAEDFDSVIKLFEKSGAAKSFHHSWLEFKETLIIPQIIDGEDVKPIQNSLRPNEFFHYGDIKWSPAIFSAWPNVFVGVGLFLTFIGLAAAIGEAAAGVASSNVAEAQISLGMVLNAAKVKFLTSIAGLGVSIILGLIIRFTGWRLNCQIHQMCENLEKNMLYAFSENIQQQQLYNLEQQTQVLKQFTDNFAVDLGEELTKRLDSVLTTSFAQAIAPLNDVVKEQFSKADTRSVESLENLVHQFSDTMNSGTNDQMAAIVESLGTVREALSVTTDKLSESLSGGADAISQQMTQAGQHFNNEVHNIVATMADSINRFDAGIGELDNRLKAHAELLDSKIMAVQNTIPELVSAANTLRTASQPIATTAEKFDHAAQALQQVSASFDETRTHLRQSANTMMEAQQSTSDAWEKYDTRFEDVDQNLRDIFKQYGEHIQGSQDQMQQFVGELDRSFAKAGESLGTTVKELNQVLEEVLDELPKAIKQAV